MALLFLLLAYIFFSSSVQFIYIYLLASSVLRIRFSNVVWWGFDWVQKYQHYEYIVE